MSTEWIPAPYRFATVCGSAHCSRVTEKETDFKLCAKCRSRKYCSRECQVQDWRDHKHYCKPIERGIEHRRDTSHYDSKHSGELMAYALSGLDVTKYITENPEPTKASWLPICTKKFLLVTLHPVQNAPHGGWNRLRFFTAVIADFDILPLERQASIRKRLELDSRFPSAVLGYHVHPKDALIQAPFPIDTYTHGFDWPASIQRNPFQVSLTMLSRRIIVNEYHLTKKALAEEALRLRPSRRVPEDLCVEETRPKIVQNVVDEEDSRYREGYNPMENLGMAVVLAAINNL